MWGVTHKAIELLSCFETQHVFGSLETKSLSIMRGKGGWLVTFVSHTAPAHNIMRWVRELSLQWRQLLALQSTLQSSPNCITAFSYLCSSRTRQCWLTANTLSFPREPTSPVQMINPAAVFHAKLAHSKARFCVRTVSVPTGTAGLFGFFTYVVDVQCF